MKEEDNYDLKLRVYVTGGGCSGFQYGFTFDEVVAEDDAVIKKNDGVEVLIDAMSYPYLVGAQVDYKEDLQGSKFVISNPNASTTSINIESLANGIYYIRLTLDKKEIANRKVVLSK